MRTNIRQRPKETIFISTHSGWQNKKICNLPTFFVLINKQEKQTRHRRMPSGKENRPTAAVISLPAALLAISASLLVPSSGLLALSATPFALSARLGTTSAKLTSTSERVFPLPAGINTISYRLKPTSSTL